MSLLPFQSSHLAVPSDGKAEQSMQPRNVHDQQTWQDSYSDQGIQTGSSSSDGGAPFYPPKGALAFGESKRSSLSRSQGRSTAPGSNRSSVVSVPASPSVSGQGEEWQTQFFKTKLCPYHLEGRCINGTRCKFAHALKELRPLPDLHRTKLCESYVRKEPCKNARCPFAHDPCELRTSSYSFYKVSLCNFYKKGRCWNGPHCRFAHGIGELQAASDEDGSHASEQLADCMNFPGGAPKPENTSRKSRNENRSLPRGNDTASSFSDFIPETSPVEKPPVEQESFLLNETSSGLHAQKTSEMQQTISSLVQQLLMTYTAETRGHEGILDQSEIDQQLALDASTTPSYPSQSPLGSLPSLTDKTFPLPWFTPHEEYWMPDESRPPRFNFDFDRLTGWPQEDASQAVLPGPFDKQWKDHSLENLLLSVCTPGPNRDIDSASKFFNSVTMTPNQSADRYAARRLSTIPTALVTDKPAA